MEANIELYRPHRFSFKAVIGTALWAGILLLLLPGKAPKAKFFAPPVLAAIIVQVVSPWEKKPVVRSKRLRLPWA